MTVREKKYRKLGGRQGRLHGYSRLWLGPDHLLATESTGFTEQYRRFYFQDIQAITVQKTRQGTVTSIVLTILTLVSILIGVGVGGGWLYFWAIISGLLGLFLLLNWLSGSTCHCYLQTAVQTEKLSSISRVRRAKKSLALIMPLIEAAQGKLTPEEIAQRMQQWAGRTEPLAVSASLAESQSSGGPPPLRPPPS